MQHLLSPVSFTCTTIGFLHRKLSHWERYRLTVFRMERNVSLDAHSNAKGISITKEYMPTSFPPSLPFGHSVLTTSAASRITHLTWVHLHSSYWLPSTYPTCGYQEEHPLTILFPSNGLCYIVRLATLFRVLGVIWWYRWFTLIAVNRVTYDFTSHGTKRVRKKSLTP